MQARQITPNYSVSPQIDPADVAAIKAAGFVKIICNRPNEEVPPSHSASVMEQAAREAGIDFVAIPLTHATMTEENIRLQRNEISSATGPVFAYCASGTRCSVIWSLGQAGILPTSAILNATQKAGYDLGAIAPRLDAIAENGGIPDA